jgi:hypothetical protein
MADNRIAYGLAKKYGIDTAGMSPQEVWGALKEKGVTKESAEREYNQGVAAEREKLEKRYGDGIEEAKFIPQASKYSRPKTKHHTNHAKEMNLNEREYVNAAIEFFNGDEGEMYYSKGQNKFYRYDRKTGRLAVVSVDGTLHTYFHTKERLFNKLFHQAGLKKWEK